MTPRIGIDPVDTSREIEPNAVAIKDGARTAIENDPELVAEFDLAIKALGIPIAGVSFRGNAIRIDFQAAATPEQRAAAEALVQDFVPVKPAPREPIEARLARLESRIAALEASGGRSN